jgi:acyl transferase domain-containing protein/NAD(P)H-dependent flavin oxidoreductase YrpB (nitropropane dioxygenase family)/acyl carrier protein
MNSFVCLSTSPINLLHPGLAVATTRAGGVGILDREFCQSQDLALAQSNLEKLLAMTSQSGEVGLRLRVNQIPESQMLLDRLCDRPHWLILCDWNEASLKKAVAALPKATSRKLLLEVRESEEALLLEEKKLKGIRLDGLVAKGHESGGWVGEDAAFILTQKLIKLSSLPIYVQGGIGIHTAAACRAAGAAGVILDDQLWLMPSSPLPPEVQAYLKNLNGQEAIPIGERLNRTCRVLSRPGFQAVTALQNLAEQIEIAQADSPQRTQAWQQQAQPLLGWDAPGVLAWPMGQAVGLAAKFRDRYKTVGRLIQSMRQASHEHIQTAQLLKPLQPNSSLAISHGTQYPILQGPMTRVSDVAEFANAVSQAGGLPMLALALMRQPQVKTLLYQARDLMQGRPWGVGILGFVPQALREAQLEVVKEVKPPFALIAGGRPDQAAKLEAEGIATYIHVPTPTLLAQFLEAGARRFIFEGRECGGHVGPLSSFVLWESMIDALVQHTPAGAEADVHVFFAGGIHDRCSAAMVAAMAAPLAAKGMRIGILMGTAYILTQEAVECGAIVPEFQSQILACQRTINLETGPGHASRCAVTPFAQEFYETRRQMMAQGRSPEEIKDVLEDLTLGRLRIASKGLRRDEKGEVISVAPEEQVQGGMYMIGQVATLHQSNYTLQALHAEVSQGSTDWLLNLNLKDSQQPAAPSDIAIVGIATLLPKAQYPAQYWENIIKKVDAVAEIPSHRWDWQLYYNADRHSRDKIYSKWGGFIDDVVFDPMRFGIPPKSLKSIEPMQLLALETVRRALEDAGYADGNFDREHTSVILGCGGGIGDLGQQYATRSELPRFVGTAPEEAWDRLPEWTEESFPGILLNVVSGRIASRFDFGGSNFTVDAACASSLAAIDLGVRELETGRANVAIAGGVDTVQSPFAYFCFSKTQALSPRGRCRTFDQGADGIAISEGLAMLVLKRLSDAERDGDRIYAVIKSVASSSDGKALGLTAPLPAGQRRAVNRAYTKAGFSPNTLELYEAHGTGTVAGDRAELETLLQTLTAAKAESKSCVIGSVKTSIGHTKSSAGVAGLIKVALSLYHKVLPPHLNVERPLEPISDPQSPVYLLQEARPWLACAEHPRRGAVSAFGFGGTNFHAILEEYRDELKVQPLGSQTWLDELLVWRAENQETLIQEIESLQAALAAGAQPRLADLAYSYALKADANKDKPVGLAIVASSLAHLQESLAIAIAHLRGSRKEPLPLYIQVGHSTTSKQPIAFLFSGQGSQYPQMAREATLYFKEMREAIKVADRQLQGSFPKRLSQFIYPPSAYSDAEEARQRDELKATQIAQPALGAMAIGFEKIATKLGLHAEFAGGHSYGEYAALYAAGVISLDDFLRLSTLRGQVLAEACSQTDGAMAAVQASREEVLNYLQEFEGVFIANHNAPRQCVISGSKPVLQKVVQRLETAGIKATMLLVAGAFHTPLVAAAGQTLTDAIATTTMALPTMAVYSNATARPYEKEESAIKAQLSQHLLSTVEFVSQIENMYQDGARIFIELSPKSVLTKLVDQILGDKEHLAVSFDGNGGGLRGFLRSLGTLSLYSADLNLTALFEGREVKALALSNLKAIAQTPPLPKTAWLVNGGSARPQSETVGYMGKLPPLNQQTAAVVKLSQRLASAPSIPASGSLLSAASAQKMPASPPTNTLPKVSTPNHQPVPMSIPPSNGNGLTHPVANGKDSHTLANPPQTPTATPQPAMNSSANVSPTSPSYPPLSPTGSEALAAYQTYQETMRQFLRLQEQVMQHFLASSQPGGVPLSLPTPQPIRHRAVHPGAVRPLPNIPPQPALPSQPRAVAMPQAPVSLQPAAIAPPPPQPVLEPAAPAVAPPAPVSAPQPALDRLSLTNLLVSLVSDRTGYPPEMLGLDQDLEAELGIDSIKRVEILGALQKVLPAALADQLKQQMESLTRVKSLNGVVDKLLQAQPAPAQQPAIPSSSANTLPSPTAAVPDRLALTQTLIDLVSDRTGYPPEMLGLDQDLEAELGIDSIKRVEILGALQKVLPATLADQLNQQMESLTRVKSLNGVVDKLLAAPAVQEGSPLGKL